MKLYVIKSTDTSKIEVVVETSIYAPPNSIYIMPQGMDFPQWGKQIYQAEKEKNEWIRKYNNLLKGLHYWKGKANE